MKMENVVPGPLFPVPLPSPPNLNVGKTAHAESQEVSTTLYQRERGKHVSIIVI